MNKFAIIIALFSLFSIQLIYTIYRDFKRRMKYKMAKKRGVRVDRKKMEEEERKHSFLAKQKKASRFIFRESHDKVTFIILKSVITLVIFFVASKNIPIGIILSIVLPLIYYNYEIRVAEKVLSERREKIIRILEFKRSAMGLIDNKADEDNYESEFMVLEWNESLTSPEKIRLFIPVSFDENNRDFFLEKWNGAFGSRVLDEFDENGNRLEEPATWALSIKDKDFPGWQHTKGVATLELTEALPLMAPLEEWYIKGDDIAWSWFSLGLGVNGGLLLTNPETGEEEHVIGIDLSGDQIKLANKRGIPIGPEVIQTPQTLIAGATGGGKALDLDEYVMVEVDENAELLDDDILI